MCLNGLPEMIVGAQLLRRQTTKWAPGCRGPTVQNQQRAEHCQTHFLFGIESLLSFAETRFRGSRGKHGIVSSSLIRSKTEEMMCNSYTRYQSSVSWLGFPTIKLVVERNLGRKKLTILENVNFYGVSPA